jgi:hypothetical protein
MVIKTMFGMDSKANGVSVKKTPNKTPIFKVIDIRLTKEKENDKARKFYLFSDLKNPS